MASLTIGSQRCSFCTFHGHGLATRNEDGDLNVPSKSRQPAVDGRRDSSSLLVSPAAGRSGLTFLRERRYHFMAVKHRIRSDGKRNTKIVTLTARAAIRHFCRECMGFNAYEVTKCPAPLCPLFPFRSAGRPVGVTEEARNPVLYR